MGGEEVRSALVRQWRALAAAIPRVDPDEPSRIEGWRNREVIAHLSLQPVLLLRFLETASSRHPEVTLTANLAGTAALAGAVDSSARAGAAGAETAGVDFGGAVDSVLPGLQAADLASTVTTIQGPILLVDYLATRCVEAVVHGGDMVEPVPPDGAAQRITADALVDVLTVRAPGLEAAARALPLPRWIDIATGREACFGDLAVAVPVMT